MVKKPVKTNQVFKYPISPSRIDGYKYFVNNEFKTFSEYIADLCGETQTTAMLMGKDFHRWLQGKSHQLQWKNPNLLDTPRCIWNEVARSKYVKVAGAPVRVLGYADGVEGESIFEYKTTSKSIDLEKYMDSWQWRMYLWLFDDVERVIYHVYKYNISKDKLRCSIIAHHTVTLNRYAGLDQDVHEAMNEFVVFLQGLEKNGFVKVVDGKILRGPERPPLPDPGECVA